MSCDCESEYEVSHGESGDPVLQRKSITAWWAVAGLAMALICATPGMAQRNHSAPHPPPAHPPAQGSRTPQQGHHAGQWLRKYQGVPPEQQRRALQNDPQFRSLPPQRQQRLEDRLQHFNSLPAEQQQRVLNRMEVWEHLTPEQKQVARGMASQMRNLPPQRRQMVQDAIRGLRGMPPDQRQRVIESDRFRSMFTPQERGLLNDASRLPLAPASDPNDHYVPRPPSASPDGLNQNAPRNVPRPPQ